MNEEKFIQTLRESMEQERDIEFSPTAWEDLEERLGKEKRTLEWKKFWWILPFSFGAIIIFWQWKHLQYAQEQINDLKEQKVTPEAAQDTVFEKVIIYEYDTIRKTIIEHPNSSTLLVPKELFDQEIDHQQLGISALQSSSKIQNIEVLDGKEEVNLLPNNTFEDYPKLNSLLVSNRNVEPHPTSWKMLREEKTRFHLDWLAIELAFDFDKNIASHWKLQEGFQLPTPNEYFPTSFPILPTPLSPNEWNMTENSFILQLGLDYEFKGERWQPFFGLSLAGDWNQHSFSQAIYGFSPNLPHDISSMNPPNFPLKLRIGQAPKNNIPTETEINPNYRNTGFQIMSYRQVVKMWYELNVGMKYNF